MGPSLGSLMFGQPVAARLSRGSVILANRQQRRSGSTCFPRNRAAAAPVLAAWNADVKWEKAQVVSITPAAEGLFAVTLQVPEEIRRSYRLPGQYVQMRVGEDSKPAYIAVASPPGGADSTLEFLIKRTDGTAGSICSLARGGELEMSQVMGKGFVLEPISPPEAFPNIYIFATGSGIAPIRALIEASEEFGGLAASKREGGVRLWIGSKTAAHLPYADRFGLWERAGVKVTPVFSKGEGGCYVQDAFSASWGVRDAPSTGALVSGQKAMADDINSLLTAAGVPKARIISNF